MEASFRKFTQGVFCAVTEDADLNHGDPLTVTTKYGKEVQVTVWKKIMTQDGMTWYSIVRDDGINRTEITKRRLERRENAAARQERLSEEFYVKSNKDSAFLSLGEPVKVGHHSERRHRKIIQQANDNTRKSVDAHKKAQEHAEKAATLEDRLKKEINLDSPESIALLEERIADLEARKAYIKSRPHERWELSNLGANIRRYKARLKDAVTLWELGEN